MKYMFWNKKTTKEEIPTEEEMLESDQDLVDNFTNMFSMVGDMVIYRGSDFTSSNSVSLIKGRIGVTLADETDDWVKNKNHKYVLHLRGLVSISFCTKEKADECLIRFINLINNNDTL